MVIREQVYITDHEGNWVENFAHVIPGEPYRLFPFGPLIKNGVKRFISPEYAKRFSLPHFKPPIKRGSHAEDAPAVGHIIGLEVRNDGIYAIPELTVTGDEVFNRGDFRYHSPEVIWEGGFEDPQTGKLIEGPLIVGDALLHTPHLGEAAALYLVIEKEKQTMTEEMVQVPKSFWDNVVSMFKSEPKEPEDNGADQFAVQLQEAEAKADEYKAKLEQMQAEQEQADKLSAIRSEFDTDEYGAAYQAMHESAVDMLATMSDEQLNWVLEKFRALSAQIDESNLTEEKGGDSDPVDFGSKDDFNAAIEQYAKENDVDYNTALKAILEKQPEYGKNYRSG